MTEINVVYQGQLHCEATHEPTGKKLQTDAPKDNMGKGETFSPTDLVATALGTCVATVMGIYAQKNGLDLSGLKIKVQKEMTQELPRRVAQLTVEVKCEMPISEQHRIGLEKAAHTCPVHNSLHPNLAVPITFLWA